MVAEWRMISEYVQWTTDAHSWLTHDQLAKHCSSEAIADEIVATEISSSLWKPQPEAPDLESARLYVVLFEMKSGNTQKQHNEKRVEGSAHVDPDQDAHALDAMLNGLQEIQDRETGSDADTAPCKGA